MNRNITGKEIRQSYIDFFIQKAGHTFVRSSSLVPGGDATLLFTNAGMVQFKDIFLGTDKRAYTRAVNSQKCLRVAGKHNDLEEVGRDDTHHTFFEMLGNWSFGDYYQKEAIAWAWELLTEVWGIPKENLYATVFKDEKGEIPTDEAAASYWHQQLGFNPDHLFYLGRKDNFWEMADTGPCGPCSEIHIDLKPELGPVSSEDLDTDRFLELWNLVFIQYNRISPTQLEPLPEKHVDTGMGFERIVNVLQDAGSNYRTDLFWPLIQTTQGITEHSIEEVEENITPYRVIADHARSAAFLIADGVVPGNLGRNYICRMIIRRAFRFAGKIGINEPFLSRVALNVIQLYGDAYPELIRNQDTILKTITREEEQFQKTLDKATRHLLALLEDKEPDGDITISGEQAADLYTTYGLPLEITRDIAQEQGFRVDESGFMEAMEIHRQASGAGKAMGALGGEDVDFYRGLLEDFQSKGLLPSDGVIYNPYEKPGELTLQSEILAMIKNNKTIAQAVPGDEIELILPETLFYIEAGGQVSDIGEISSIPIIPGETPDFKISITGTRKPAAGVITHIGKVLKGKPKVGAKVNLNVVDQRRMDIMRNHTATHLLHAALHNVLGNHARQAGSLVAPDRLRFDFTHPEALSLDEIQKIETFVNKKVLSNYELNISHKSLDAAMEAGAIALFGEKYEDEVRNVTIGDDAPFSNELCGGTHVEKTGDVGTFIITSEGSAAAGIRRLEAVTGRGAYHLVQQRFQILNQVAKELGTTPEQLFKNTQGIVKDFKKMRNQVSQLRENLASFRFERVLDETQKIHEVEVLTTKMVDADAATLRQLADRFRQRHPTNGVAVLASIINNRPVIIAAVTEDLVPRGIKAGDLAGFVARQFGGGGGGKPTLAQAGGKDASKVDEALDSVSIWVDENLNPK